MAMSRQSPNRQSPNRPSLNKQPRLMLASASPRRAELLRQIGVEFSINPVDLDERVEPGEAPETYVRRLALAKAQAVRQNPGSESCLVLGSDTSVVLEGVILGKPQDEADFVAMLSSLAGRRHQVWTGVALVRETGDAEVTAVVTDVSFRAIEHAELTAYWRTGEPCDKAGGYGIQGKGAIFVERIEGSYSAVMGLPLFETAKLLRQAGFELWSESAGHSSIEPSSAEQWSAEN